MNKYVKIIMGVVSGILILVIGSLLVLKLSEDEIKIQAYIYPTATIIDSMTVSSSLVGDWRFYGDSNRIDWRFQAGEKIINNLITQSIEIKNTGNKASNDIDVSLEYESNKIVSFNINPSSVISLGLLSIDTLKPDENNLKFKIKYLNPEQSIKVDLTIDGIASDTVKAYLASLGAEYKYEYVTPSTKNKIVYLYLIAISISLLLLGLISFFYLRVKIVKELERELAERFRDADAELKKTIEQQLKQFLRKSL